MPSYLPQWNGGGRATMWVGAPNARRQIRIDGSGNPHWAKLGSRMVAVTPLSVDDPRKCRCGAPALWRFSYCMWGRVFCHKIECVPTPPRWV
jgi:hypothetical protein